MPLCTCTEATYLYLFEPVATTDMLKAKSHIPCRAPAFLRSCRSERDISTPSRGTAWAQQAEWINIGRLSTAFGRPAQVRLLPVTTRTFSRVVFQNAATFGMCVIVLMTMETADYTEYELALKIKPVFLLSLCYVSIVSSFHRISKHPFQNIRKIVA